MGTLKTNRSGDRRGHGYRKTMACEMCGKTIVALHNRCKFCAPCSRLSMRKSWRKYSRKNRDRIRVYQRALYQKQKEKVAARVRKYRISPAGKRAARISDARMLKKYPKKTAARKAVANAVRTGRLNKRPCIKCGNPRSHGHHPDYSKPLKVIWLCAKHHTEVHRRSSHD